MPKKKKLSQDIIDTWPDVFEGIDIQYVPVEYLDAIRVTFHGGKIWDIDVKKSIEKDEPVEIEEALADLFETYVDEIENIDFRVDTLKVKKDIKSRTALFMKKRR